MKEFRIDIPRNKEKSLYNCSRSIRSNYYLREIATFVFALRTSQVVQRLAIFYLACISFFIFKKILRLQYWLRLKLHYSVLHSK